MYKRGFIIFGVVSLTMGNSPLPFADGLVRHVQLLRQLPLGHVPFFPSLGDESAQHFSIHGITSAFMVAKGSLPRNRRSVEWGFRACGAGKVSRFRARPTFVNSDKSRQKHRKEPPVPSPPARYTVYEGGSAYHTSTRHFLFSCR